MPAHFNPEFDPADVNSDYGQTGGDITVPTFTADYSPFKFWCQKTLPLVFDDSLSYYEVLCKLVTYVNNLLTDLQTATGSIGTFAQQFVVNQQFLNGMAEQLGVNTAQLEDYINDRMDDFSEAYASLQEYVNTYFANLDVQEEINTKLDEMAQDGTLDSLLQPFTEDWLENMTAEITADLAQQNQTLATQNARLSVLEGRMDTFSTLPAGSTSANAELVDIRTNFLGETYSSAGEAVRASDMITSGYASLPKSGEVTDQYLDGDVQAAYNEDCNTLSFNVSHYKGGRLAYIFNVAFGLFSDLELGTDLWGKGSTATPDSNMTKRPLIYEWPYNGHMALLKTYPDGGQRILVTFDIPENESATYYYFPYTDYMPGIAAATYPNYLFYASNWSKTPVDDTLTQAGQAADSKATGDAISEVKSDFDDYLYGAEYSFIGNPSSINKFAMPLLEGLKYTATNNTGENITVILYKADGTSKYISTQLANGASVEFTVDGKDYIQIGGWFNANSTGPFVVQCDFSSIDKINDLLSTTALNTANIASVQGEVNTVTKDEAINITEEATKHENQFYNVNNTFYAGGNQWDYYSLEVTAGDAFTIDTVAGQTVRGWAFRDANGNQLSIASYSGDVVQKEYTNVIAPANSSELLVNFKHVSGYLKIIKNALLVINENRIFYNGIPLFKYLDRLTEKSNILHGKVLCCCGDSITYGADLTGDALVTPEIESYQWSAYTKQWTKWTTEEPAAYGYQIAARNGMTFYNGGVSGACVQGSGGTSAVPGFSVAEGEYTLLPNNIDYLTLFFGWNDTATGSLGTINDTTNDSYYGGYNVVLPYLINKYPYTKIALIVPYGTDIGHRHAIRELANKWGLACFDMYKEGTPLYWGKEPDIDVEPAIVTANREKFWAQANSPHPNIHGHYQISTMLEQFLRAI